MERFGKIWYGLLFLAVLTPGFITAQGNPPEEGLSGRVLALGLDSTRAGVTLYYSEGYKARGEMISEAVENARLFYLDSLGIDVSLKVALLDTADFTRVSPGNPYGLPFINDGVIMLPADTSLGAVKSMFAPFGDKASAEVISNLNDIGFTYAAAVNHMVDLIGLHEIGHAQAWAYQLDPRQKWFSELMASYFAYAYLKAREPRMAVLWDNITRAGFEEYHPENTSLDVFNELYVGVGVGNYAWYQSAFQERIREIYPKMGLNFIRQVHERLADPSFQPETAMELLEVFEEVAPGFIEWANSLEEGG